MWLKNVSLAEKVADAQDIYAGRGFTESLATANTANTEPWIISAGLGLIHARDRIPTYNLTIVPSTNNSIQNKIKTNFCPSSWWFEINKKNPNRSLSTLIKKHSRSTVLLSLSQSYSEMVQEDLLQLDDASLRRLRIVGLADAGILPGRLQGAYMPYDTRINDPKSGIAGTMSDFPQRAAHHFVERIWCNHPTLNAINHAALVEKSLHSLKKPVIPLRQQMTNEEIKKVITKQWNHAQGQSGKMLRILRDQLAIACEQKRFSILFNQIKEGNRT